MLRWIMYLIAGYKIFSLVQEAKSKISFEFLDPKSGDFDLIHEKMRLRIRVKNGNPIGFPIDGITGKISQGGQLLGEMRTTQIIEIPANSFKDVVTDVSIIAENIFSKLAQNFASGQWTEPLVFQGTVFIKDRSFPVQRKINLV